MWASWQSQQQEKRKTFLRVSAGTSYNKSDLIPVYVNCQKPHENENIEEASSHSSCDGSSSSIDDPVLTVLESSLMKAKLAVRIQEFQVPNQYEDTKVNIDSTKGDSKLDSLVKHDSYSNNGDLKPPNINSSPSAPIETNNTDKVKTTSSPYFSHPLHTDDRLSIQISISFKPESSKNDAPCLSGNDIVWGNDFDEPIRDNLPYGLGIGLQIMKYTVDPSIEGDIYCDKPYLYGPILTSFNKIQVGITESKNTTTNGIDNDSIFNEIDWPGIIENDDIQGEQKGIIPDEKNIEKDDIRIPQDSIARSKFFLNEINRKSFQFELYPAQYSLDFYTPYLELGKEFAINLPGFKLNVEKYGNGQPLRYTLKNIRTEQVYLVVVFELITL